MEVGNVEHVIAAIAIDVDNAVWLDFTGDYGDKSVRFSVANSDGEHSSSTLGKAEDGNLARRPCTVPACSDATKITFIDLNFTRLLK
jgi:hypothetical protein